MALQDATNPQLYRFADKPQVPDEYHSGAYLDRHKGTDTCIVIDNGSSQCRVGWASEDTPRLVFRNAIAKSRGKRGEADCICIGNDIANVEAVRSSLRNQFDRNLVSNFTNQEQILDHAFSHLGMGGESSIDHAVVVTEPVCNPAYCRSQMSELMFECYNVPAVSFGVDALFSLYHNCSVKGLPYCDALVVSSGHQTTHILPVLDGRLDASHAKRVNLGGMQSVGYIQRLLQLKYPDLQATITLSRAQELLHHHGYTALDYLAELKEWEGGGRDRDVAVVQLPFVQSAAHSVMSDVAKGAKDKQRRQRAREQLLKMNKRKKEDKIATYQVELDQLLDLQQQQESLDPEEFQLTLDEVGYDTLEALLAAVRQVQSSLESEQEKLASLERNLSGGGDDPLSVPTPSEQGISEEWLQSLKGRREDIFEQKRHRQARKAELGNRRSAASQQRMRIISRLAEDPAASGGGGGGSSGGSTRKTRKKEDTFGQNDDDWNVYRAISKHAGESDSEREDTELSEISKILEKHDPGFVRFSATAVPLATDMASYYQLLLGVERFRAPEIVFQPPMVGVDQCGVVDTIEYILQGYPATVQQRLAENVFVTGGNSLFPNFVERLEVDVRTMRPFQSKFKVSAAGDRLLDAWRGGCNWGQVGRNRRHFVSRAEYSERGPEYFKEHEASNLNITPSSKIT